MSLRTLIWVRVADASSLLTPRQCAGEAAEKHTKDDTRGWPFPPLQHLYSHEVERRATFLPLSPVCLSSWLVMKEPCRVAPTDRHIRRSVCSTRISTTMSAPRYVSLFFFSGFIRRFSSLQRMHPSESGRVAVRSIVHSSPSNTSTLLKKK